MMSHDLTDILALTAEPAVLVKRGKISFANTGAERLFGPCVGERAEDVLGLDPGRYPAQSYLVDTMIQGENYVLRINALEEGRMVFLDRQEEAPVILNDAFLYTLRSNLMTLGVATDRLRPAAEDMKNRGMMEDLTALTSSYFKLMRLSGNASLVRSMYEHRAAALPVDLDLSLLCHAVMDTVEEAFQEVRIVREIQAGLRANMDAALFKQLLFNLLSNCLRHAHATIIQVRLYDTAENVLLAVSDNGDGIPAQAMYTVFDRYRYNYALTDASSGAGLGLTAARCITQLHGGTLLLESRPDQGTSVRASFSRRTAVMRFGAAEELCTMRDALLGLADCMPLQFFEEKYLD